MRRRERRERRELVLLAHVRGRRSQRLPKRRERELFLVVMITMLEERVHAAGLAHGSTRAGVGRGLHAVCLARAHTTAASRPVEQLGALGTQAFVLGPPHRRLADCVLAWVLADRGVGALRGRGN